MISFPIIPCVEIFVDLLRKLRTKIRKNMFNFYATCALSFALVVSVHSGTERTLITLLRAPIPYSFARGVHHGESIPKTVKNRESGTVYRQKVHEIKTPQQTIRVEYGLVLTFKGLHTPLLVVQHETRGALFLPLKISLVGSPGNLAHQSGVL